MLPVIFPLVSCARVGRLNSTKAARSAPSCIRKNLIVLLSPLSVLVDRLSPETTLGVKPLTHTVTPPQERAHSRKNKQFGHQDLQACQMSGLRRHRRRVGIDYGRGGP